MPNPNETPESGRVQTGVTHLMLFLIVGVSGDHEFNTGTTQLATTLADAREKATAMRENGDPDNLDMTKPVGDCHWVGVYEVQNLSEVSVQIEGSSAGAPQVTVYGAKLLLTFED